MLQLGNDTPFPAQLGLFVDPCGHQTVSVVLKATFAIPGVDGAVCQPAITQLEVSPAPIYEGAPGQSSIRYPADLVPQKPGTDVVFVGHAYTPGARRMTTMPAHLHVGPVRRSLEIVGDRWWTSGMVGTSISSPEPFTRMPIVYERAFGGPTPAQRHEAAPFDERNPIGTGFCTKRRHVHGTKLPNVEHPRARIRSWRRKAPVMGLGAIDAHWAPRREYAGTYDRQWREERCPVLPQDFDPRFHQVAGEGLFSSRPLRGLLNVTLVHLSVEPWLRFVLPYLRVGFSFYLADGMEQREGDLWTILLEPDELRVVMVWGASCRIGKRPSALEHVELHARRAA